MNEGQIQIKVEKEKKTQKKEKKTRKKEKKTRIKVEAIVENAEEIHEQGRSEL